MSRQSKLISVQRTQKLARQLVREGCIRDGVKLLELTSRLHKALYATKLRLITSSQTEILATVCAQTILPGFEIGITDEQLDEEVANTLQHTDAVLDETTNNREGDHGSDSA